MDPQDVLADSSSAPTTPTQPPLDAVAQAVVSGDVAAYRDARRAERRSLDPSKPADSTPPVPADPAASTDATASPASEPGKAHKNAETRIRELLAERKAEQQRAERAERELEALRTRTFAAEPPASRPAVSSSAPDPAADPEPKLEEFEADPNQYPDPYTAHQRALARWEARQEFARVKAEEQGRLRLEVETHGKAERASAFKTRLDAEGGAEFVAKLHPDVQALRPVDALDPSEKPTVENGIAQRMLESSHGPALMRHFSDHPADLARLRGMPMAWAMVELGKIEARLETSAAPATPPKTVTTAPSPPAPVTTRNTDPGDDFRAVMADVGAYRAARLRERIANRR